MSYGKSTLAVLKVEAVEVMSVEVEGFEVMPSLLV